MRNLTIGVLIFMAGLGLGWYAYDHWGADQNQSAQPVEPIELEEPPAIVMPTASEHENSITSLLQRNEFEAAVQRFEALQPEPDEASVEDARAGILSHARRLIEDHRFSLAEELLQRFLLASYRDVEARILLAAATQRRSKRLAGPVPAPCPDGARPCSLVYQARHHAVGAGRQ
jgi:Flp pilus assembly protein TadD